MEAWTLLISVSLIPCAKLLIMKILITNNYPVIEIQTQKGSKVIALKKILYVQSLTKGTVIFLKNSQQVETHYILKAFSNTLPAPFFFRCHNSFIVNCQYVDCFWKDHIYLLNKSKVPLSRRRKKKFKENLIEYVQSF